MKKITVSIPIDKNLSLIKSSDGYWLCVKAPNKKYGMISLNNLQPPPAKEAFLNWAETKIQNIQKELTQKGIQT